MLERPISAAAAQQQHATYTCTRFVQYVRLRVIRTTVFATPLDKRVSCLGTDQNIPLRRRRPHDPASTPPCRPSPGAVEAGGHGGGRGKRKCLPRVDKKASKRRGHSDFQSGDHIHASGYTTYIYTESI